MTVSDVSSTSASSLDTSRKTIASNFDSFLSLLTTQLKNQNPLDPLDTNQFTQQLVQFTSVEQQLKTNEFLQAMMLNSTNSGNTGAVSYIGKTVTADGAKTQLTAGSANWAFSLKDAANVNVTIKDKDGNVVYTEQGSLQAGDGVFKWDGKGSDGNAKPDGAYTITMEGRNGAGGLVPITTQTTGVVTGVDFTGAEPVLMVGNSKVNLSSVTTVRATS